jgi:hypothetical protein
MHRGKRRDVLERFISNGPDLNNQLVEFQKFPRDEEEELNPFANAFYNLSSSKTSSEEQVKK